MRLGAAVRVIDFDDVDTSTVDPVAFDAHSLQFSDGVRIQGEDGQFASRVVRILGRPPADVGAERLCARPISSVPGEGGN